MFYNARKNSDNNNNNNKTGINPIWMKKGKIKIGEIIENVHCTIVKHIAKHETALLNFRWLFPIGILGYV